MSKTFGLTYHMLFEIGLQVHAKYTYNKEIIPYIRKLKEVICTSNIFETLTGERCIIKLHLGLQLLLNSNHNQQMNQYGRLLSAIKFSVLLKLFFRQQVFNQFCNLNCVNFTFSEDDTGYCTTIHLFFRTSYLEDQIHQNCIVFLKNKAAIIPIFQLLLKK